MSEYVERTSARQAYRTFVSTREVCQYRCVGLYESDPPMEPWVEVEREDALNCFLRKNPQYARFREDCDAIYPACVKTFQFKTALWNETLGL